MPGNSCSSSKILQLGDLEVLCIYTGLFHGQVEVFDSMYIVKLHI